jgi:cardiolipin synthase
MRVAARARGWSAHRLRGRTVAQPAVAVARTIMLAEADSEPRPLDQFDGPSFRCFTRRVLGDLWPIFLTAVTLAASLVASGHAVLRKRDVRAALAWIGFIWVAPILGAIAYGIFGVNRIRRRAIALRLPDVRPRPAEHSGAPDPPTLPPVSEHLRLLTHVGDAVVRRPLVPGNAVRLLPGGAAAYPAMLAEIEAAKSSVTLCTYIFDVGGIGDAFADALVRAHRRGVAVRVLIDAVGARYRWPPVHRSLRKAGVPTALFLERLAPAWLPFVNLRNHRKILVVDGRIGFTGGMNVRDDFMPGPERPVPFEDLQVRLEGPIVAHLQSIFAEDWYFTVRERLEGAAFFPSLAEAGPVLARGISDGPDEDFECLRWVLLGAIASARESVQIVTPYFLPDAPLITALNVAALRQVKVDLVLQERGNLKVVQWAQAAQLWQVLDRGCRVWLSPPPFDHTKLMVVDGHWTLLGSANWDARSLRLNFEVNVECYDAGLAAGASALVRDRIGRARRILRAEMDARPLPVQLRDGVARLFSPYL